MKRFYLFFILLFLPLMAAASEIGERLDLTGSWVGIASVLLFFVAYLFVMVEEFTHLRKSKPVMLVAGIIWGLIAWYYQSHGIPDIVGAALRHNLLEYAELMLFLLVAMTFVNAMDERNVFEALRSWLIRKRFGYRALFWVTGALAFFMSPIIDNLTTALLMGAVVMAVGVGNRKFITLGCINIVVAANAGGAFSPFGDITTLMVWQKHIHATNGVVDFWAFFALFVPSLVNWLMPAVLMHFAVPDGRPGSGGEMIVMKRGALPIMGLFLFTIALAVSFHSVLDLPPVIGMLTGLSLLQFFFLLPESDRRNNAFPQRPRGEHRQPGSLRHFPQDSARRMGYAVFLLRRGDVRGRTGLHRLPRHDLAGDVRRLGRDQRQHRCRPLLGYRRQHPGDVRGTDHAAGHVGRPVAAGDADCRCRRFAAVDRLGCGGRDDGAGAR